MEVRGIKYSMQGSASEMPTFKQTMTNRKILLEIKIKFTIKEEMALLQKKTIQQFQTTLILVSSLCLMPFLKLIQIKHMN
jgi:hypothetical protein